ncbi:MAG: ImmA/IrrE family metallo-endopeptidase [Chloroflexi bacterium]|nr:ImmA/IrrE family metallo-endopeptidase [Chloroflexota bacterium]
MPCFGMSTDPSRYALELVEKLNFQGPSTDWIDIVVEHLGLKSQPYSGSDFFTESEQAEVPPSPLEQMQFTGLESGTTQKPPRRHKRPVEGALRGKVIHVDSDFRPDRQRMTVAHEVGHYHLPWHRGLTYVRDGCLVEPPGAYWHEQEAHRFAADLLMPPPFFQEDMNSLPWGLHSVERLSLKYWTSVEATARQYVRLSSKACAFIVAESVPTEASDEKSPTHRVRYCVPSPSFDHFLRPGTKIALNLPLTSVLIGGTSKVISVCETTGVALGLRPDRRLILHYRRWGQDEAAVIFAQEPRGPQVRLF